MKRYEDTNWQETMKIKYDFNNLMDEFIDAGGQAKAFRNKVGAISKNDIISCMPKLKKARISLERKWGRPSKMLSWTKLPYNQKTVITDIQKTALRIGKKFDNFIVLGIGGSALGPIAVQSALNHMNYNLLTKEQRKHPKFFVIENIDPERIIALLDIIDVKKTCFNVITKSGSTSETMSQFLIFSEILKKKLGDKWYANVIATTDKKKGNLIKIAKEANIKTFVIPDGVGGRFSEMCPVGLLPAAVCGIDILELLAGAAFMLKQCQNEDAYNNPGWMSGLLMYIAMQQKGKNIQVMMPYADALRDTSAWFSQLWAESLGKKFTMRGRVIHVGQTPVKALGVTDQHSQVQLYAEGPFDKVITFIGVDNYRAECKIPHGYNDIPDISFLGGHTLSELIKTELDATEYALTKAGKLNQRITLPEINEFTLGQLLTLFEVQTAVTGELLGIDAFNQPGVEEGKIATYALMGRPGYEEKRDELDSRREKLSEYII